MARMPKPKSGQTAEEFFGKKTGRHSHPDTHPHWMEFSDSGSATGQPCPRCTQPVANVDLDRHNFSHMEPGIGMTALSKE